MRRSVRLFSLVVAVALLAGCTETEAGSATAESTPNGSSSGSQPSEGSSPSSVDIPPPPRDLSLEGLDPCTLLTEPQLADLEINDVRPNDGSDSKSIYKDMKECSFDKDDAEPFISYDVVAVTNVDVDFWINRPSNADVELIDVGGYPAAQFHIRGSGKYDCAIALGVAKNQHLHVEMLPLNDDITDDQICQGSKHAAEMALQTLQTMR